MNASVKVLMFQVDVGKLTSSAPKVLNTVGLLGYPFLPVVDSYFGLAQDTEFFPDDPWNLLEEGKFNHNVSILMGCAQFEGLFYMGDYVNAADRGRKALEHIFSDPGANVPSLLNLR